MPALLLLWLLLIAGPVTAAVPQPTDFAAGCPLPLVEDTGLYALTLPLVVYERLTRADLGDLRVFNGAGEPVPHALRRPPPPPDQPQTRLTVPFFALPARPASLAADLSLQVSRQADGTVIRVESGQAAGQTGGQPVPSGYLLDTSALQPPPAALELTWADNTAPVFTLALADSSDLSHWSPLVDRAVLADLNAQGRSLSLRRIALPRRPLAYIRLACLDCRPALILEAVTALATAPAPAEQWQWLRLDPEGIETVDGEQVVTYSLPARIAVTGLQLRFGRTNSLVRATIQSRPSTDLDWQTRARGSFYRLNLEGKEQQNDPALCPPTSDTHWRLRMDAGTEDRAKAPQLELGWQPEELVFVGRGPGPYTLAFGSARLATAPPDDLLLTAIGTAGSAPLVRRIEPGPVSSLGGEQALQPDRPALPWQRILLWIILLAGVGLLAAMARTIYREIQAGKR